MKSWMWIKRNSFPHKFQMSELHPRLVKNAIEYGTALLKGDGSHNTVLRLHVEKEIQLHQSTLTTVPEMKHHLDRR